jgi:lipoate-protein ligase A
MSLPVELSGRFIDSGPCEAAFNMALDDALMECATGAVTLRVYGWKPPALSLGYFQPYGEFEKYEGVHPIVRRVTGGGAIFHANELTYSITCRLTSGSPFSSIPGTYELVHGVFRKILAGLGVTGQLPGNEAIASDVKDSGYCFYRSAEMDVLVDNRKLIGSAQRRRGDRLLMHGSMVLGKNPLTPKTACITENLSEVPRRYNEISLRLRELLEKALDLTLYDSEPPEVERQLPRRRVDETFAGHEWTRLR